MEETQAAAAEGSSISNIVGMAMVGIILLLGVMLYTQSTKLGETVKLLAAVSTKCAQK